MKPYVVLANPLYRQHMTDEGMQLQDGLAAAGWQMAGLGYGINSTDITEILERARPEALFIQDVRDWHPDFSGCYDPSVAFTNFSRLRFQDAVKVATVCKDAATTVEGQRNFAWSIRAKAIVLYYHPDSAVTCSPWLKEYELVRTYHTVDAQLCQRISLLNPRGRALVSGALSEHYPLRMRVFYNAQRFGVKVMAHPGYGMPGHQVRNYLQALSSFKVHVATASKYGFALRKIIESVAMGATPVTDLPAYDVLPEIDGALVRVPNDVGPRGLKDAIDRAEADWDLDERLAWAERAWEFYDWRPMGRRLSQNLGWALLGEQAL